MTSIKFKIISIYNSLKTFILLHKTTIIFWSCIVATILVGTGLGIALHYYIKTLPYYPEYPIPSKRLQEQKIQAINFDDVETRKLFLPQFPKNFDFPAGGIVVRNNSCPHGPEVILPGQACLDRFLVAAELQYPENHIYQNLGTFLQFFPNMRRLPTIDELSNYLLDNEYFIKHLNLNEYFCFVHTNMIDYFPHLILKDMYGRPYYIITKEVIDHFLLVKEFTLEEFKLLCNACDYRHYGLFSTSIESAFYILTENEKAFSEQLTYFTGKYNTEVSLLLFAGLCLAVCLTTGITVTYIIT